MAESTPVEAGLLQRILVLARDHLGMELSYIGEIGDSTQAISATSGDTARVGMRAGDVFKIEDTFCARMLSGEIPPIVQDTTRNSVTAELGARRVTGAGAYLGVPIELADGSVFGTLCALSSKPEPALSAQDTEFMRLLAGLAAWEIDRERAAEARLSGTAAELEDAIRSGAVTLFYQPKLDLTSGRIRSVEALARWVKPDGTIIPPDSFIPLATETGLDGLLTERVMDIAVTQVASWSAEGVPLRVAVNVPAGVLRNDGFVSMVGETLDRHGVSPVWLEIELTESDVMRDAKGTIPVLRSLSVMGIHLAIDDFGTGYSSLSYLRDLRVNTVKIDKSFVIDLGGPGADLDLVQTMIELAHNLGLLVVAEGVEDADTARLLRDLGCETIQGYWLSRPVVPGSIAPLLDLRPMEVMGGADAPSEARFHLGVTDANVKRADAEIASAETTEEVARALAGFVVRAGGSVVPADLAGRDAVPVDIALGAGPPLVVLAPEGTRLRGEFERWLPELIRRAQLIG